MPPIPQTEDGEIRGAVALSASIGRGRHGETFEAELGLEEAVAAKRFFLGAGWDVGVFKAEAKAAQLLAGVPYVVTVLGYKTEGGPPLLLSTLAAGALSDVLGGASTAQKLLLLTQAAVGLAGLHAFGAVHGDLSSNSLLLSGEGEMRVKGGGFVRTRRAVDRGLLGTAGHANAEVAIQAYSAPELFGLHSSPRTAATDVFAFGPVVWQVMSGCAMSGQHDPVSGRPAKGWRPDTGALPPDAPRGVAALCERCWAEAPAARPAAAEVVDAMLALSEAGGVPEAALSIVRQRWAAVQAEARTAGAGAMPQAQAVIAAQPVVKATPAVPAASAQPAARAAPLLAGTPHATLTPLYMRNPPVWQTDATDIRLIPEDLAELFLPLTPQARAAPTLAVCVPFYSEDGYALRRGIEALACQRADLRRYWARCKTASPGALPELHVFAVADGWKKDDGSDILASSMLEEIIALYGDSLDVEALVDYMEGKEGGGEEQSPDAVLIQFAVDVPGVGLTQSPLLIDVTWAANMDCREGPPESGVVPMAMRQADAAEAAAQEQGAAARQLKSAEALAQLQPGGREKRVGARAAATSAAVSAEDEAALAPEQPLFVTLMIKRQNGRKHHSQQWYFEAWAPVLRIRSLGACMYYMSTDAGTLFAPFCLAELWEHMDTHPSCAACTGHQRIMSKNDQADPNRSDAETYAEGFLRAVQGYDFESGLCVFNGMHALAGFLPVVPGPCGFFRAAALTDSIIEQVRTICTTPARDDGLVQGNLKIAEDRILSYLLLLADDAQGKGSASVGRERLLAGGGGTQWQTGWVPSTKFFFEAETTLKELVLQRRRWLNGTQAGYIWLLSNRALWHAVCSMRFMAIKVLALSLLQMVVFSITFVMPGITIVAGYLSLSGALLILDIVGEKGAYSYAPTVQMTYLVLALSSFLAHIAFARVGHSNFEARSWAVRVGMNAALSATNAGVTVGLALLSTFHTGDVIAQIGLANFEDLQVATALGTLYATTPFFLSYMHSRSSFETTMGTFPSYFLFSLTMLSDMYSYSVARADDLSWGTKATAGTSKGSTVAGSALRRTAIARATAARARFGGVHVEAGTNRARQRTLRDEQRLNAAAREESWRSTNALTVLVVVASLSLAVVNSVLNRALQHYLLYVGAATASVGIVIMTGSFVFFASRALFSASAGNRATRFWALCCAGGWLVCAACVIAMWLSRDHTARLWKAAAIIYATAFGALVCIAAVRFGCTRGVGASPLPRDAHSHATRQLPAASTRATAAPGRAALAQSASRPEYVALDD